MTETPPATQDLPDHANTVVHPPVFWAVLVAAGYGLDWLVPLPFLPDGFPAVWTGLGVFIAGLLLAGVAIASFRRAGTEIGTHTPTQHIVDTGIYGLTRNPIYLGAHIGLLGAAIGFDSLWILAMIVPFYLVIRHGVVGREEAYLERCFGDAYLDYKRRVRRWI